jgi:formylglycine-generating enzyme required for sulfatase activity
MRKLFVAITLMFCLAGITAHAQVTSEQQDQQSWDKAQQENSVAGYDLYLKIFPDGHFASLAKERIDKLKIDLEEKEESELWKKADSSNDQTDIETYLKRFPSGRYRVEADAKLKLIREELARHPLMVPQMVQVPGKNYEIGKYEVSQAEWRSVMGNNPSKFKGCGDNCPVEKVSWDDVQVFIQKLNAATGKQYRLPTEAEWEYACYGGIHSEFCGGDDVDAVAWTSGKGNELTHPVGQKQANGYGLYDMSGNVMEWTTDCWEGNCAQRVFRGGSWINDPRDVRVSYRIRFNTSIRNSSGGFRLVRTTQ